MPEIIQALKDSIAHWKRMQADMDCGEEPYTSDCPLCKAYVPCCDKCPARRTVCDVVWGNAEPAWDRRDVRAWPAASQAVIDALKFELSKRTKASSRKLAKRRAGK
ncbi:MAG: hypothetical protein IMZ50_15610 [Candidatus Atribacteria bacterium]|nr:hypothetical protein [Candidatus Atribacteria bacterium]